MFFLPLLFTVFLDYLGFGLLLPVLSPLLMESEGGILPADTSVATRGLLFGLLISSYFLFQFFSSPILGALSDRKGRKVILLYSLMLTTVGFLIGGLGIILENIYLLFLSRILAGFAAGNYVVAQAAITDICDENSKAKAFGLINMALGTGFIIGPFIGGKLSDPSVISWGSFATPFWFAVAMSLVNILWIQFCFKETLSRPSNTPLTVFKGIQNLQKAFGMPTLRMVFIIMFLFSFGWGFFTEFFPLFLIQRYSSTPDEIGNLYAFIGCLIAVCQGFLIRPFVNRFSPRTLMLVGLICLGMTLPIALSLDSAWMLYWILPVATFFESLIYPNASTYVSNLSSKETQGETLGIHQSVQSAGIALSPLFSGSLVALYPHLPITVASSVILIAGALLLFAPSPSPIFVKAEKEE